MEQTPIRSVSSLSPISVPRCATPPAPATSHQRTPRPTPGARRRLPAASCAARRAASWPGPGPPPHEAFSAATRARSASLATIRASRSAIARSWAAARSCRHDNRGAPRSSSQADSRWISHLAGSRTPRSPLCGHADPSGRRSTATTRSPTLHPASPKALMTRITYRSEHPRSTRKRSWSSRASPSTVSSVLLVRRGDHHARRREGPTRPPGREAAPKKASAPRSGTKPSSPRPPRARVRGSRFPNHG